MNGGFSTFDCAGNVMVGGYNNWGAGATAILDVASLAAHSYLRISFNAYAVDSWDHERYQLYIDGVEVYARVFQHNEGTNLCGASPSNWKENFFPVDIIVEHSGTSAQIRLQTTLNQGAGDESWGFSDFKLSYLD